ncbi:MAG: hypothetical protein BGO78_15215 [Chloroflexi bacterium 44-23]|jgi:hypothetical protein|nr:MAG: hypothetical protein BGO78_15215 [Chloroflexi bacterium 44-23]
MIASKWLKWLVIGGVALVILGVGFSLLSPVAYGRTGNWAYDDCSMWGSRGMMDNWGGTGMLGYSSFGWFGMFLGFLIPVGFIALLIAGGIWLVKVFSSNRTPFTPAKVAVIACSSCGQNVQANWRNCPHCGSMID